MSEHRSRTQEYSNPGSVSKGVLAGNPCIVAFPGNYRQLKSQPHDSSCGLAALNFARVVFQVEQACAKSSDILGKLATKEVIENLNILTICTDWSNHQSMNVDDLRCLPIFERSLRLVSVEYTRPESGQFRGLLEKMRQFKESVVMIVTRPPDAIACFKFSTEFRSSTSSDSVYVVFDPHPRPSHPLGAGLSFSTSVEETSRTMSEAMPLLDDIVFDSSKQNLWGYLFVAKTPDRPLYESRAESSLTLLSLRAQLSVLEGKTKALTFENQPLRLKVDLLKDRTGGEQVRSNLEQGPGPTQPSPSIRTPSRSFATFFRSIAGSSNSVDVTKRPIDDDIPPVPGGLVTDPSQLRKTNDYERQSGGSLSIFADNPPPVPTQISEGMATDSPCLRKTIDPERQSGGSLSIFANNPSPTPAQRSSSLVNELDEDSLVDDGVYTLLSEELFSIFPSTSCLPISTAPSRLYNVTHRPTPQPGGELSIFVGNSTPPPMSNPLVDSDSDSEIDVGIEIDEEWIRHALKPRFTCGICLEEQLQEIGFAIDDCSHMTCRDCFKDFVCSKIEERRFPVFCPMCMVTDQADGARPSEISTFIVERLEVTERQLQIWTEMELAEFFVQIHCRQCNRPSFVDRQDYAQASKVLCPQIDCTNVWCKKCDQTIPSGGPPHSCDGSSELDHLIRSMAWQRCPACTTPVLRIEGCHFMTCVAPGCRTSFCYQCGGRLNNHNCPRCHLN